MFGAGAGAGVWAGTGAGAETRDGAGTRAGTGAGTSASEGTGWADLDGDPLQDVHPLGGVGASGPDKGESATLRR